MKEESFCLFVSPSSSSLCALPLSSTSNPLADIAVASLLSVPRLPYFFHAPSSLLCCPAGCAAQPTSGWEGWWGTLNLLMQPFVAIASELALPLPGSAVRCSRTLPQPAAIGYLLLSTSCMHVCIHNTCCPNKGSTNTEENMSHASNTHVCSHKFMLTQTPEDNEGTHILIPVSHKLIFPIWVQTLRGAIMKYKTFYLAIQVNSFQCIRPRTSLNFKTQYMHRKEEPF